MDAPGTVEEEIRALCAEAFREDLSAYFDALEPVGHAVVRGSDGALASHGLWVERWLQVSTDEPLRCGFVELVATRPADQGRGLASLVMSALAVELRRRYPVAALSPATYGLYRRLGWRLWEGPLHVRRPEGGTRPTPDDEVMVLDWGLLAGRFHEPLSVEWRPLEVW